MKGRYYSLLLLIAVGVAIAFPAWNAIGKDIEGLVFYLSFDEQDVPVDHSSNPAKLSVKGKLKQVDGKFSNAAEFDGASIIEVEHSDKLEGMNALTIEVWIKPTKLVGDGMAIASKRIAFQQKDVYNLFLYTGWKMDARVNAKGEFWSQTAFKAGDWHHVAYVFDGNAKGEQQKMYVDGILEAKATHTDQAVGKDGAPLWIGELDATRGFKWNGVIDELGIWNIALSEAQIKQAMAGEGKKMLVEPQGKLTTTWGKMKR